MIIDDHLIRGFNESLNQYARAYCEVDPPPVVGEPCQCHGVPWQGWFEHMVLDMDTKFLDNVNGAARRRRELLAKPNCRHCHGRGRLLFKAPDGEETEDACPCVSRAISKVHP